MRVHAFRSFVKPLLVPALCVLAYTHQPLYAPVQRQHHTDSLVTQQLPDSSFTVNMPAELGHTDASRKTLPKDVRPVHYDVSLKPNLHDFVFSGTVDVQLQVVKSTDTLVFHGKDIEIQAAAYTTANGKKQVHPQLTPLQTTRA